MNLSKQHLHKIGIWVKQKHFTARLDKWHHILQELCQQIHEILDHTTYSTHKDRVMNMWIWSTSQELFFEKDNQKDKLEINSVTKIGGGKQSQRSLIQYVLRKSFPTSAMREDPPVPDENNPMLNLYLNMRFLYT